MNLWRGFEDNQRMTTVDASKILRKEPRTLLYLYQTNCFNLTNLSHSVRFKKQTMNSSKTFAAIFVSHSTIRLKRRHLLEEITPRESLRTYLFYRNEGT